MSNILKIAGAGVSAAAEDTDENFNQTVLLLHGDGTNGAQNNTFLDSSTNNFTITRNGNTTQGTFSPFSAPDGRWSNYFDGSGNYIEIPENVNTRVAGNSFTLECWIYPTANQFGTIFSQGESGVYAPLIVYRNASGYIEIFMSSTGSSWDIADAATSNSVCSLNEWSHIAVVRDGNNFDLYINGSFDSDIATSSATLMTPTVPTRIGSRPSSSFPYAGYVSNTRLVIGTALYTSAFTPSTSPLTTTSQGATSSEVELLTCQSNRFVDNATTPNTITINGNPKVTPFSPFAPTAAYSASVNGGSGYFDGTGDYLTSPASSAFNFGTGDFTFQAWFYIDTDKTIAGGSGGMIFNYNYEDIQLYYVNTPAKLYCDIRNWGTNISLQSTSTIAQGQWYHVGIVRDGASSFKMYLNGALEDTELTNAGSINLNAYPLVYGGRLGPRNSPSSLDYPHKGYIAGTRILNGTAIDFASTGIPTAPPTAITNTELLLNFTNAGIFDNTGKNVLETVGNAQIDTTTKKYGTGSMYFNGSAGSTPTTRVRGTGNDLNLGGGDFTVELWYYPTAHNSTGYPVLYTNYETYQGGAGYNGLVGLLAGNKDKGAGNINKVYLSLGDNYWFGTTTIPSLNTWTHIALVRNVNRWMIFINGTLEVDTTETPGALDNENVAAIGGGIDAGGLNLIYGYIDDFRLTKGVARYTTTFTPPTKAYPDL